MSKLKEKELLDWLDEKVDNYNEQAYQQIRECISLAATIPDVLDALQKKLDKKLEVDTERKARELFGWSADPRTIKECEDFIRSFFKEE